MHRISGMIDHFVIMAIMVFTGLVDVTWSREIDSYTHRSVMDYDSVQKLNAIFNQNLEKAIVDANRRDKRFDKILYRAIGKRFGGNLISKIEIEVEKNLKLEISQIKKSDSIYRDVKTLTAPALLFYRRLGGICKIDDHCRYGQIRPFYCPRVYLFQNF